MSAQKNKKYIALLGIVFIVIAIIGLFAYGTIDKYKGLIKVKTVSNSISVLSASISNAVENTNISRGSDEIDYNISYTLDRVEGVDKRDVIIKGTLNDSESKYARFKRITGNNISSNIINDGKEIEIEVDDVELGVDNNIVLKVVITNAPNGFKIRPNITIKEKTSLEETTINTNEVQVSTETISGLVKDESGLAVGNIELSLNKNGEEIRRTYTDNDGNYNFSDIESGSYEVNAEEEIFELVGNNRIDDSGVLNLEVKEVKPYEIEAHKYITSLDLVVNGKEENYTYDDLETVAQVVKNAKTISGKISYKITIKNIGEKTGKLSMLKDKVDEGLSFDSEKNSGWTLKDESLYYEPINNVSISSGETREVNLVLDIKNTNEIKKYINEINVNGETYERVVYILNGMKYKEETVILGEKITEPVISDPDFSGWYTDINYTNKYNFKNEVTKDLILYGKIEKHDNYHTVLFMDGDTLYESQSVKENDKATSPENNPSKSHNIFKGWLLDDELYNFNTPVTRDLILYSSYEEIEAPAVSHTPTEWTNQNVLVTITNQGTEGKDYTGYSYKYRVNNGEFRTYNGPFEIEENCDIYAIAIKNNVDSVETKHEITNIDKIKPIIDNLESVSATTNSVDIEISSHDNESGLDLINIYNGETLTDTIIFDNKDTHLKTVQYTITDLEPGTTYEISVLSKDVAGNVSDRSFIDVTTIEEEKIVAQITHVNNVELDEYILLNTLRKGIEYNEDGINCFTSQCTIQMLDNVIESNEILEGQDITLDLNGKNVVGLINYTINNNGFFTLLDTATDPGTLSNNISTSIINTGTLTLGINDERLEVSVTHPSVYGSEYGVYTEGTFNFYDGIITGSSAIVGIVNNTPDLYGADVRTKTVDEVEMQVATLKKLTDPEARIGRVYYNKLADAFAAAKNGTYEDVYVDDESFMEEDTLHEYTFVKDQSTGYLVSNNYVEGTRAIKEMVIDLTSYVEDQELTVDGILESSNVDSWGNKQDTARIHAYYYGTDTSYTSDSFDEGESSKTIIIKSGMKSRIEIEFATYNDPDPGAESDSKFTIKNITLAPNRYEYITTVSEDTSSKLYGFDYDYQTQTYKSNNNFTNGTLAFSYYEVDLTNKEGNYLLTLNAILDTYDYRNKGFILVKEDNSIEKTSYIYDYLGMMQSNNSGQRYLIGPYNYSKVLEAGKKYYVQFYYFKSENSSYSREEIQSSGCDDQFIIKSLNVVKTSTETEIDLDTALNTISNGFTRGNVNYNVTYNSPADSFVEIDLTNSSDDELITINSRLNSQTPNSYFYLTNKGNNLDFNELYNDSTTPLLSFGGGYNYGDYYVNGNYIYSSNYDFNYVLKKGYKYYLHVASFYNNPSSPISTTNSLILNSIKRKVIDSTLYDIGAYKINKVEPISTSDSLIQDNTDDKNYRFVGAAANNYISFNDELWRIVGIFETENQSGAKAKRLKIMKNNILSYYSYDSTSTDINNGLGINEWSTSDAMKLLNPGYTEEQVGGSLFWNRTSGNCYNSSGNYNSSCDFTTKGIKDDYKSYIDTVKWYTSALNAETIAGNDLLLKELYELERGNDTSKDHIDSSLSFDSSTIDTVTRTTTWYGKVGLPYLSDINYTAVGTSDAMISYCNASLKNNLTCINNNSWFHARFYNLSSSNYYVINPSYYSDNGLNNLSYGLCYYNYKSATPNIAGYSGVLVPTLYLSTKTKIDSGTGTSGDPFMISLGSSDNPSSTYGLIGGDGEDEGETVSVRSRTDDYRTIKNIQLDTFNFDSETGYYTSNNAGKTGSVAKKLLEIDLTNSEKDKLLDYDFNISSNNGSFAHFFVTKNNPVTVYINNGTYSYDYNDSVYINANLSGSWSNSNTVTLERGYKYYIGLYYFKYDSSTPTDQITDTFKIKLGSQVDTSDEATSTYRAYKGQRIIYNDEVDTIQVLKDINLEDTIDIEETKDVILDLYGYRITSSTESTVFSNSGQIKVIDTSIDNSGSINKTITNNATGTFILDSGSIETDLPITNKGNLVINGLVNSLVPTSPLSSSSINNEGTISGTGTLTSISNCGINNTGKTITGITINSNNQIGICNNAESTISGVTFSGNTAVESNSAVNIKNSSASNSKIELYSDSTITSTSFGRLNGNSGGIVINNSTGTVYNESLDNMEINNSDISLYNAHNTDNQGKHKNTNVSINNSDIDEIHNYSNASINGGTGCKIHNEGDLTIINSFESNPACSNNVFNQGTLTIGEKDGVADNIHPKITGGISSTPTGWGSITYRSVTGSINFYDGSITGEKDNVIDNSINEIEENYVLKSTVTGNTETITLGEEYVASINGTNYRSIKEAIDHVTSSTDLILIIKDIIIGNQIDVDSEYDININLNGHNIKSLISTAIFNVETTLNLYASNESSEIDLSSGKLVINNGTTTIKDIDIISKASVLDNNGTLDIRGNTITLIDSNPIINNGTLNSYGNTYNISSGTIYQNNENAILNIEQDIVYASTSSLYIDDEGQTTVRSTTGSNIDLYKGSNGNFVNSTFTNIPGNQGTGTLVITGGEYSVVNNKYLVSTDITLNSVTVNGSINASNITVNGGTITSSKTALKGSNININSGRITANNIVEGFGNTTVNIGNKDDLDDENRPKVSTTDPELIASNYVVVPDGYSDVELNFYDGKITNKKDSLIADRNDIFNDIMDGYNVSYVDNGNNTETRTLLKENRVKNLRTDQEYVFLKEAFEEANTADTLQLIKNIDSTRTEGTIEIPLSKTIILDLNGKTITKTNDDILFNNKGNLIITGDNNYGSTLVNNTENYIIDNEGTISIDKVSINTSIQPSNVINNTGNLVIDSAKVKPFINNQEYTNIINNSGSVTINDIEVSSEEGTEDEKYGRILNTGTLTINSGTFNYSRLESSGILNIHGGSGSNVNVSGTTIVDSAESMPELKITSTSNNLTINNMKGSLTLNDSSVTTINNITGSIFLNDNSNLTINNGTIDGIEIDDSATITINGGTIREIKSNSSGNINITGGTIHNDSMETFNPDGSAILCHYNCIINMGTNDTTVTKNTPIVEGVRYGISGSANINLYDGSIIASGNQYTSYIAATNSSIVDCTEGYDVVTDRSNNKETMYLSGDPAVRNITKDNEEYYSLRIALSEARDNDELELLRDITILQSRDTITNTKSISLDMKGYSIVSSNQLLLSNTGTMNITSTVNGSSISSTNTTLGTLIDNSGTLNISSISMTNRTEKMITNTGSMTINSGDYSSYYNKMIENKGTLVINNGNFTKLHDYLSASTNPLYSIYNDQTGTLTINNGTFNFNCTTNTTTSKVNEALIYNDGELNITGGTYDLREDYKPNQSLGYIVLSNREVNITGGTFTGNSNGLSIKGNSNISGVTISTRNHHSDGTLTISNSTLSNSIQDFAVDNVIISNSEYYLITASSATITNCTGNKTVAGDLDINNGTYKTITVNNEGVIRGNAVINGASTSITNKGTLEIKDNVSINNTTGNAINNTNGTLTIKDNVTVSSNAIAIDGGIVTLGEQGGEPSTTNPSITGNTIGISASVLNFHDGIVRGSTSINASSINIDSNYEIQTAVTDNVESSILVRKGEVTRVVTMNNINYESIQAAINAIPENGTGELILQVDYTLTDNVIVPTGKTANLHLNGFTFSHGSYSISGVFNEIDDVPNGLGGAIYRFFASITGTEISPRNIIIYQMEDGTELVPEETYKLYKLIDNEYKLMKVTESEIGNYNISSDTDIIRTTSGQVSLNQIGEGTYKLVGSDGKELEFEISSNSVSSNIRVNRYSDKRDVTATAIATLILQLQTGIIRTPYILIMLLLIIAILGYMVVRKKISKEE